MGVEELDVEAGILIVSRDEGVVDGLTVETGVVGCELSVDLVTELNFIWNRCRSSSNVVGFC